MILEGFYQLRRAGGVLPGPLPAGWILPARYTKIGRATLSFPEAAMPDLPIPSDPDFAARVIRMADRADTVVP